jgi:leader peptidase (prepilin peptidase) / N-methyltransferase
VNDSLNFPSIIVPLYFTCVVVAGLALGSFAGCCIYRIPREISLLKPARSYCPHCGVTLKPQHNLPVISWLLLRGRCGRCGSRISPVYLIVELLVPILFLAIALRVAWPAVIANFGLALLMVIATFVDIEFFLIPDLISISGIVLGLLFSFCWPVLHHSNSPLAGLVLSLAGCLLGGTILYLVSEGGKLFFGRYKIIPSSPIRFSLVDSATQNPCLMLRGEPFDWASHFLRSRDRIVVQATEVTINDEQCCNLDLCFYRDRLKTVRHDLKLEEIRELTGRTQHAEFPREAMGLGDVKLMAAIGAFVGWQGVLFTIPVAAFLGCIFGLSAILLRRKSMSTRVPFGPFLSAGAVLWVLCGPELVGVYQRLIGV